MITGQKEWLCERVTCGARFQGGAGASPKNAPKGHPRMPPEWLKSRIPLPLLTVAYNMKYARL
eukprot:59838-Pyramimonas_sp.AAC.1